MRHVAVTLISLALILPNTTGCWIERINDRKLQEAEWRHQERMRELDIQEKRLHLEADAGIVRDNPF